MPKQKITLDFIRNHFLIREFFSNVFNSLKNQWPKKKSNTSIAKNGFTLIELLVVISIISLLASILLVSLNVARIKAKAIVVAATQRQLQKALELYLDDMGFYPPNTPRGVDPGFSKPLPYSPLEGFDCNTNVADCPICLDPQCPADWQAQVLAKWRGPYIASWPGTPWGGMYDFNYFSVAEVGFPYVRYGCTIPPGIYMGAQGDQFGDNNIPQNAEQILLDLKLDYDNCLDGESQMLLQALPGP